jgi:branched-chain amino acid transport system ATP-binding protein
MSTLDEMVIRRLHPARRVRATELGASDAVAEPGFHARGVKVHFGGIRAVDGVDLDVEKGEILGVIGPNGAGKTTLVNALTGFQKLTAGSVYLDDRDVTSWPAHIRGRNGIVRTFQAVRLFARMTVRQNLELGGLGVGLSSRDAAQRAEHLIGLAEFGEWADASAKNLPHGVERQAGVLRALATGPQFLMLDEPAAGQDEGGTDQLGLFLQRIRAEMDCGLLLIEHDMRLVMGVCTRVQVLDYGQTICIGSPDEVRRDPRVLEAYLGAGS